MAFTEMFFVQVFDFDHKKRLVAGRVYPASDASDAIGKARALAATAPGAVAFTQMVDQEAEDAEEPILLAYHGSVPPEARAA